MTTLILTPTQRELRVVEPELSPSIHRTESRIELCGFGPVVAAARTMQLITRHRPTHIILIGIAGSLRAELAVGEAKCFRQVKCDGIGAGTGANHQSASEIGWKFWATSDSDDEVSAIGDVITLAPSLSGDCDLAGELLTVCAASANDADVASRVKRHPDASAEDMEGFGVAVACHFGGVPLQIIRGISNRAGDRDQRNWDIDGALQAASELASKAMPD